MWPPAQGPGRPGGEGLNVWLLSNSQPSGGMCQPQPSLQHNPPGHPLNPLGMAQSCCIQTLEHTKMDPCPVFTHIHLLKLQRVMNFLGKSIWSKCFLGRWIHDSSILLVHEHRAGCLIYRSSPRC